MGFNTTILILNDGFHSIEDNLQEWFQKIRRKANCNDTVLIGTQNGGTDYGLGDVGAGSHVNCSSVIATHHADETVVMAVGGNCATILAHVWNGGHHHTEEDKVKLLKEMAAQHGYKLVKLPVIKEKGLK